MKIKYEPVRVLSWISAAVVFVGSVVQQVGTSWNESTGWYGLGMAVFIAVAGEVARTQTRSKASLDDRL